METSIYIKGQRYVVPTEITTSQWATISAEPEDKKLFLATVLKCNYFELSKLQAVDIEAMYAVASLCLRAMESNQKHSIDFERLTFGQFVDLDVLAHERPNQMIVEITSRLLEEDTSELPLSKTWPLFKDYMYWRTAVYKQYRNLFNIPDEGEDLESNEGMGIDIVDVWYDAIMILSNEVFMNMDAVTDKPYRQALNYLAWRKDKVEKEAEQMKKIQQR